MASINNIQWSYKVNAPRPLDASSVFTSLKDAQDAAKTAFYSGTEVASSAGIPYYIGQILTVVTDEGVALYQIQAGEKDANGFVRGSETLLRVSSNNDTEAIEGVLATKQDVLSEGTGISIEGNVISVRREDLDIPEPYDDTYLSDWVDDLINKVTALEEKEDKDTTYTAGEGIDISVDNVVSIANDVKYDDTAVWGELEAISEKVSAIEVREDRDTIYGAGDYIKISDTNAISVDRDSLNIPEAYDDFALISRMDDLTAKVEALESKDDEDTVYIAGKGISISDTNEVSVDVSELDIPLPYDDTVIKGLIDENEASVTSLTERVVALEEKDDKDTTYTAGEGIDIIEGVISVREGVIGSGYDDTAIKGEVKGLSDRLNELEALVNYKAIAITSLKTNIGTTVQEVGNVLDEVVVSWTTSKTPTTIKLNSVELDVNDTSKTFTSVSKTTSYKLEVTDERDESKSSTVKVTFGYGIYCGHSDVESGMTADGITALTKTIQTGKAGTYTPKSDTKKYIYFASPVSYGACSFSVGGFSGGFEAPETISITNSYGTETSYYVYRSTNILGDTTIKVS